MLLHLNAKYISKYFIICSNIDLYLKHLQNINLYWFLSPKQLNFLDFLQVFFFLNYLLTQHISHEGITYGQVFSEIARFTILKATINAGSITLKMKISLYTFRRPNGRKHCIVLCLQHLFKAFFIFSPEQWVHEGQHILQVIDMFPKKTKKKLLS